MFSSPSSTHFRANRLLQRGPRSVGFPMVHGPLFSGLKCTWVISFERFKWLLRCTLPSLLQPFLRLGLRFFLESWAHEKKKEQTPSAQCCSCFRASCLQIRHCRPLERSCPYSRSSELQHGVSPFSCSSSFSSVYWAIFAHFHGFQGVMQMSTSSAIFPRSSSSAEYFIFLFFFSVP